MTDPPPPPAAAAPPAPRKTRLGLIIAAVAVALLVCCGIAVAILPTADKTADSTGPTSPILTSTTPAVEPSTSPPPPTIPAGCERVPPEKIADLMLAAVEDAGMSATGRAGAYRSTQHTEVWFVAVEFTATGVSTQVGVWATNSIDAGTTVGFWAVDGTAHEFSDWGDVEDTVISPTDPAVAKARACLR